MKNVVSKIFLCALAAMLVPTLPREVHAERQVSVDELSGLQLSGYGTDDKLQWSIATKTAKLAPGSVPEGDALRRGKWLVEDLELTMFSHDGEAVKMRSKNAVFMPGEKLAESDAQISATGEDFSVSGEGWTWNNGEGQNEIAVKKNVRVELSAEKKSDSEAEMTEKILVTADSMKVTETNTATSMKFSGNVIVRQNDIRATCDKLEILVPSKIQKIQLESGEADARDISSAVRKISGTGSARIEQLGNVVSGDALEFYPAHETFYANGNAKFINVENKLEVVGEKAIGNISKREVEILGSEDPAHKNVVVTLPSVAMQKYSAAGKAHVAERMLLTGKKLIVHIGEDENVITLDEKVRLLDGAFRIDCNQLTLFTNTARAHEIETERSREERFSAVRRIVADGEVKGFYEGRELKCDTAELFPPQKRIILEGKPSVSSPEEGFALSGHHCEILVGEDKIIVFASPNPTEDPQRVEISLPPLNAISSNRANRPAVGNRKKSGGETKVVGDNLVVSRDEKVATFDMAGFVHLTSDDLSGSCDRIVVFADPDPKNTKGGTAGRIRQIEAIGNVVLEEKAARMTGWHATVENDVVVKEWIDTDADGKDGANPFRITIDPNPDRFSTTRPRFFIPVSELGSFSISFRSDKGNPSPNAPVMNIIVEGDRLEVLAGTARTRFWLRGNVEISTNDARGTCDAMEGLLLPRGEAGKLEPEKVIGRGNIKITHDDTVASGDLLEIFPPRDIAVLRGNATLSKSDGTMVRPGNDRFVLDMKTRELRTGANDTLDEKPEQVSRPKITIPRGRDVFLIPHRD